MLFVAINDTRFRISCECFQADTAKLSSSSFLTGPSACGRLWSLRTVAVTAAYLSTLSFSFFSSMKYYMCRKSGLSSLSCAPDSFNALTSFQPFTLPFHLSHSFYGSVSTSLSLSPLYISPTFGYPFSFFLPSDMGQHLTYLSVRSNSVLPYVLP